MTPERLAEIRVYEAWVKAPADVKLSCVVRMPKTVELLAHIDQQAARIAELEMALQTIRRNLPYPADFKGQKVGVGWSVPPSTAKELRRIVAILDEDTV